MDERAYEYFKQFGNFTMAYTVLSDQGKVLKHFEFPDKGLIGYADNENLWLMIGDPLCSKDDLQKVISSFLEKSKRSGKTVVGVQVGLETGKVFADHGYHATHMGVETILDVQNFNLKGKSKTKVRRWINTSRNAGVYVKEDKFVNGNADGASRVAKDWLNSKLNKRELDLMTRKSIFGDERDARTFFAYLEGEIIGYVTFDPMCEGNKISGYYADICRFNLKPNGLFDIIFNNAREKFKEEGMQKLSLGIAPLAGMNNDSGLGNPFLGLVLASNYHLGNKMYSFKGLEFHKNAYFDGIQSEQRPTFYLSKGIFPIVNVIKTFSQIGIVPNNGFLGGVWYFSKSMAKDLFEKAKQKFT
jgi:lysylphosphatidylglycerol synthetase-like protein (DUF2156 family)